MNHYKFLKLIIPCVVVILIALNVFPINYYIFQTHKQKYYANLASDCRTLFIEVGHKGEIVAELRPDDPVLPVRIKDLHATAINITPKGVGVYLGHGIQSYALVWGPNSTGLVEELLLVRERSTKLLYSSKY